MDVSIGERPFVVLNVDETSLATVRHGGLGMVAGPLRSARARACRPRDRVDRLHTKITYIAVASDNPHLQPLLPQVVLPKYTKRIEPPASACDRLASHGFPLEFWHGTNGVATVPLLKSWATRVRSVVHSWNDDANIVLLMDCSSCHLSLEFIRHLNTLGIVVVLVPAKLTWLLQIMDVFVFGPLKADMRLEEMRVRGRHPHGRLDAGDGLAAAAQCIRRTVVNRDWSAAFDRLGAAPAREVRYASSLHEYLSDDVSQPALPSLAEVAEITGRPPATHATKVLHSLLVRPSLLLARRPADEPPKRGAHVALPRSRSAVDEQLLRDAHDAAGRHRDICDSFLASRSDEPVSLSSPMLARQVFLAAPTED